MMCIRKWFENPFGLCHHHVWPQKGLGFSTLLSTRFWKKQKTLSDNNWTYVILCTFFFNPSDDVCTHVWINKRTHPRCTSKWIHQFTVADINPSGLLFANGLPTENDDILWNTTKRNVHRFPSVVSTLTFFCPFNYYTYFWGYIIEY